MKNNKQDAIGGYLEFLAGIDNPTNCWKNDRSYGFNSGRNALGAYLLKADIRKIYLPSYICPDVLEPLNNFSVDYDFYNINQQLESDFFDHEKSEPGASIIYVNYFGVKDDYIKKITSQHHNVIIDNTQAYYSVFDKAIASFNSCRKFFGVPDGGFLNLKNNIEIDIMEFPIDKSTSRFRYLLERFENEPEAGYPYYVETENSLSNLPIMRMSILTCTLISQMPFEEFRMKRTANFKHVHKKLRNHNALSLNQDDIAGPMVYPFLHHDGKRLKEMLIKERIFVPTFWPGFEEKLPITSTDSYLRENIVPLPIDQRYGEKEMERVIERVMSFI